MTYSFELRQLQYLLLMALLAAGCGGKGATADGTDAPAEEPAEKVPAGAELVSNQRGNVAHYVSSPGTVFVVDGKTNRIIFSGPVDRGQKVILYAEAGRLLVNGIIVPDVQIDSGRNYKLYILRG